MKIYTGTGDRGQTSLFSGERVKKSSIRVAAYGTVDELSSVLGVVRSFLGETAGRELDADLCSIQKDLFQIGAVLATLPAELNAHMHFNLAKRRVDWLEQRIDAMQEAVPPLRNFILPAGHQAAAMAQLARAVCRRSERCVVELVHGDEIVAAENILKYLNRLSDLLFVVARTINVMQGVEEETWSGSKND